MSIKRTDGNTPLLPPTVDNTPAAAPVKAVENAPAATAPSDQVDTSGRSVAVQTTAEAPRGSTGIEQIKVLLSDENFGEKPNVKPGYDLAHDYAFDPSHMAVDLGVWGQNELAAGGERSAQLKALLQALPDALAPLDPALYADIR